MPLDVVTVISKVPKFIFTGFQKTKTEELNGLRLWLVKTGNQLSIPGFVAFHFLSGKKDNNPLSPDYVPSLFSHIKSPAKRKLEKGMERFERTSQAKREGLKLKANVKLPKLC